jgi:hypothetical protein
VQTVETPSCDLQIRVIKKYSKQQLSAGYIRVHICRPFQEPRNRFPAWRAGSKTLFVVLARQATKVGEIDSSESIPGLHKRLQIRALAAISSLFHCVIFLTSFICSKHNRYTEYTQQNSMSCAGIFKLSMGARNRVGIGLSNRARIFKRLRSSRIDSKVSIPPAYAYVAWRAGTTTLFLLNS